MKELLVPLNDDWGDGSSNAASYPKLSAKPSSSKRRAKELEKLVSSTIVLGKTAAPGSKAEKRALPENDGSTQEPRKKRKEVRDRGAPAVVKDVAQDAPAVEAQAKRKNKAKKQRKESDKSAQDPSEHQPSNGAPSTKLAAKEQKKQKKKKLPASTDDAAQRDGAPAQQQRPLTLPSAEGNLQLDEAPGNKAPRQNKRGGRVEEPGAAADREDTDAAAAGIKASRDQSGGPGLLDKMAARLSGSKFRWLNETLYTTTGDEAFELMQEEPSLFEQYHSGFQQQTKAWPQQPVDVAIAWLKSLPASLRVADFGCGDAALALAVPQRVACLDLVATQPGVIECNMADTPLESESMDIAIFCLALMGTDYPAFLVEATRVLKPGGWLWIAEVRSRFSEGQREDFRPFLAALARLGYRHDRTDAANKMFVVFRLRKAGAAAGPGAPWPELKPCLYKRR